MTPIVRRFSNGLIIEVEGDGPPDLEGFRSTGKVSVCLEWDEAAVLEVALRHELYARDVEEGLAPHAPAGVTCHCGEVHK